MREFEQKKKLRRILTSPLIIFLVLIIFGFVAKGTLELYFKDKESRKELEGAKAELARLEDRQNNLSSQISAMETEGGLEKEIRDKFQVAKKGEQMLVILDNGGSGEGSTTNPSQSFWQKVFRFFKK